MGEGAAERPGSYRASRFWLARGEVDAVLLGAVKLHAPLAVDLD